MTDRPPGLCGIYEASVDAWKSGAICHARCSVCQHTWTHYREDSATELFLAHLREDA